MPTAPPKPLHRRLARAALITFAALVCLAMVARWSAIVEMTGKRFGCVCVEGEDGRLAGLITDGDLRRHMGPDLMTASVDDVMTKNPRTIAPGMLASEIIAALPAMLSASSP